MGNPSLGHQSDAVLFKLEIYDSRVVVIWGPSNATEQASNSKGREEPGRVISLVGGSIHHSIGKSIKSITIIRGHPTYWFLFPFLRWRPLIVFHSLFPAADSPAALQSSVVSLTEDK